MIVNLLRLASELLGKRQYRCLDGCQRRMEMEYRADIIFLRIQYFLVISGAQERENHTV